jgi:hypothetical protein
MAPRVLACAVILSLGAIACGQSKEVSSAGALPCNNGVCKLEVTVESGNCANPANIKVTPDPVVVRKGSPNRIEWTIKTNGFTWVSAPGGITGLPPAIFENPHDTGSGKKYDIHDKNPEPVPTDHKYDIHLKDPSGNLCAVKDPTIRNGA